MNKINNQSVITRGTVLRINHESDGIIYDEKYILADTYEDDFVFQVISISGYHSGAIEGYIETEEGYHKSVSFLDPSTRYISVI